MQQDKGHCVPCTTMRDVDIPAPPLLAELMGEPWVQPQQRRDEDGVGETSLEHCGQLWSPQCRKGVELVEHSQRMGTKMTQGMELLLYKDRLRARAVQHGEEKALGRAESGLQYQKGL